MQPHIAIKGIFLKLDKIFFAALFGLGNTITTMWLIFYEYLHFGPLYTAYEPLLHHIDLVPKDNL